MNTTLRGIAAGLAAIVGAMAVVAGGQVLLGKVPDYYVIDWLPVYNFAMGVVTVLLAAPLIWKDSRTATPVAVGTFGAHAVVMLILLAAYRDVVAPDSIVAMSVRLTVWLIVLALMFFRSRRAGRVA